MFSGIVQACTMVKKTERMDGSLRIRIAQGLKPPPSVGDSVAVNGVCLTVEQVDESEFQVTAVAETLRVTTLGTLKPGSKVNLEPALRVGDPLGGHWVLGHVDGTGIVRSTERRGAEVRVGVEIPVPLRRYVAAKGSLALDGVSLTVASWSDPVAEIAIVPHTEEMTTLRFLRSGDTVNLEVDMIARYLDRLLEARGLETGGRASEPSGRSAR